MSVGISSACFYPTITEDAVDFLCKNGVKTIEIFFNSACETKGKIFNEIYHKIHDNGVNVVSVHPFSSSFEPFMLFSDYERRFQDGLDFYKNFFEVCAQLGSKIFVLHGDREDRTYCDDRYLDRYHRLFLAAKEMGIILAQENVAYCRSKDISFLKKMKNELCDDVAFVLDLKQSRRAGIDYREYASVMGEKLVHLHANDFDSTHDCLLPGKGITDFNVVYNELSKCNFQGDSIIEVYRSNFKDFEELLESIHYLECIENKK